ncbi:MAG: hypothetical protein QOF85_1205 [Solirubrobacterales bacterium]|jgi:hypothetical protein|nr:hypothetical protein [Solirubrobacterales bacterium]
MREIVKGMTNEEKKGLAVVKITGATELAGLAPELTAILDR